MRNLLMLACVAFCLASIGCCGPMGCGPGCGIPVGCNDCDGLGVGQSYGVGARLACRDGACGIGGGGCGCGVGACGVARPCGRACGGRLCGVAACGAQRLATRACNGAQLLANGACNSAVRLQSLKRSLVCGSGCGETYLGEWISTPPDAFDPCSGDQFVGGATKCRPFCWQRGTFIRGLYGGRYCSGSHSAGPCGCGSCGDGGCGGEFISDSYIAADDYIETDYGGGYGSGGCTTCDASHAAGPSSGPSKGTRVARSKSGRVVDARSDDRKYR